MSHVKKTILKAVKNTHLACICQQLLKLRAFHEDKWWEHGTRNKLGNNVFFFSASIVLICRRTGVWSSSGRSSCLPSKKRRDLDKSDTGDSRYSVAWFYFYDFAFVNYRAENSLVIKSPPWPVGASCSGNKVGDETQVHMLTRMCVCVCGHSRPCHCLYAYICVHLAEDSQHTPERWLIA